MDMTSLMAAPPNANQEAFGKEAGGHADMMAQVLMGLGRVEAKLDMILDSEEDESEKESESNPNPLINSTMLELDDLPPVF